MGSQGRIQENSPGVSPEDSQEVSQEVTLGVMWKYLVGSAGGSPGVLLG